MTKLAAEHLCTLYHHNFGLPTVSLRYFTVYGPRQRPDMAFHRFCKAILQHQPIHIYDDGEQIRDFTYISDVIEANIRAATSGAAIGQQGFRPLDVFAYLKWDAPVHWSARKHATDAHQVSAAPQH